MAAPGAEAPAAAPGGGAVGGQSAQIVQQILMLLTQLGQEQSDPNVQRLVQSMMGPAQDLEKVVAGNDTENMSSGLENPGGPGEEEGEGPGAEPAEGEPGKPAVTIAIHAGKPKDFAGAKKAAGKAMRDGSLPSETDRTKNRKKG